MTATILSISLPESLSNKLNQLCESEERSKSFIVKKALEKYLAEKKMDFEDYKEAKKLYKEYKASGKKGASWDQIKKKHKL